MRASDTPTAAASRSWRARAVFLSSTFADMHAERDYLRLHTFPELEERLRDRCHDLEVIDLRQGVETAGEQDEAQREAHVLKVCLDEIARARPCFVGLIGDRYGWVPPEPRVSAAARDAGLDSPVGGLSVTELEVLYGVLADPARRARAWFYLRECDYTDMPPALRARFDDRAAADPAAARRVRRLESLKARLRHELPNRVRTYHARWDAARGTLAGLEALADLVREDLWRDLDAETRMYLREAPATWQDAARRVLGDFVAGRTRGYVARPAVTEPLLDHLLSPVAPGAPWGLCLTGESGSGKSTIFSRLCDELRARPDVVVLAHAAGIDPHAGGVEAMLRRWAGQLAAVLGERDPFGGLEPEAAGDATGEGEPPDAEAIVAGLLSRVAAARRVVVLVDALNQFEATTRARHLTWLPRAWPANARLLATAVPGLSSAALRARAGVVAMTLAPVTRGDARAIAARYFRDRYHREPNPQALDVLLDARLPDGRPAHGNPLWLELALQEMNLLEADDYARADRQYPDLPGAERMQALLCEVAAALPPDAPGVYGWLLDRAERGFGREWTRALLGLIAIGRAGWRERDLRALLPEVCAQPWDELTFAGVRRTLGTHLVQRGLFAQWDVFHAGLRDAILARQVPPSQRPLLHALIVQHLFQVPPGDPIGESEMMVHLIGMQRPEVPSRFLGSRFRLAETNPFAARELAQAAARLAEWLSEAVTSEELAGRLHWLNLLIVTPLPDLDGCLDVARALLFHLDPRLERQGTAADSLRVVLLESLRRRLADLMGHEQATPVFQARAERELSAVLCRLGDSHMRQGRPGDIDRAGEAYEAALAIDTRMADRFQDWLGCTDLAVSLERVGGFHLRRARAGDLERALDCYERSLAIRRRLRAEAPDEPQANRALAVSMGKVADVLGNLGDLERARSLREEVLARHERQVALQPDDLEAWRDLSVALGSLARAGRAGHPDDVPQAIALTQRALAIGRDLVERHPDDDELVRDLVLKLTAAGDACADRGQTGDLLRARAHYEEALAVETRRASAAALDLDAIRGQAMLLGRLGNLSLLEAGAGTPTAAAQAWDTYSQALVRFRSLAAAQPSDAQACRDLLVAHIKLARAATRAGRTADVQAQRREIHQLLVRMHASGLWLDATTEALLAELDRDAVTSGASVMPPSRLAILRSALGLKDD